ncbi:MAG: hypothetical protein ACI9UK_000587 [Candidatus Krumholzibacteriia bacterium]|jgi:hypothetical protein
MKNFRFALVVALLKVILVGEVYVFDGVRNGFMFSHGGGVGRGELNISGVRVSREWDD